AGVGTERPDHRARRAAQDLVQLERRAGVLAHREQGLGVAQALLRLLVQAHDARVQARVLDGDRHLVGDDLQELLLVGLGAGGSRGRGGGGRHCTWVEWSPDGTPEPASTLRGWAPPSWRTETCTPGGSLSSTVRLVLPIARAIPPRSFSSMPATPSSAVMSSIERCRSSSCEARRTKC